MYNTLFISSYYDRIWLILFEVFLALLLDFYTHYIDWEIDNSLQTLDRRSEQFTKAVENIFHFSMKNVGDGNEIQCPCMKCGNMKFHMSKDVRGHIYCNEFNANYQRWIWHGEYCEYDFGTSSQFENVNVAFDENDITSANSFKGVAFNI